MTLPQRIHRIVMFAVLALLVCRDGGAQGSVQLSIDVDTNAAGVQSTRTIVPGQDLIADVLLQSSAQIVAGADVQLGFNAGVLKIKSLRQLPLLTEPVYELVNQPTDHPRGAWVSIATPQAANGALMRVTFEAIGLGQAGLSIVSSGVSGPDGLRLTTAIGAAPAVDIKPQSLTASPLTLRFGATRSNGVVNAVTAAQEMSITIVGPSTGWTASANTPWVSITGGAGSGTGRFVVAINPAQIPVNASQLNAVVTVTPTGSGYQAGTGAIQLNVTDATLTQAPFGAFDTPAHNSTGLVGAIAVTGWALDDIGVKQVDIWRNCVEAIDRARGACAAAVPGGPPNFVFIGRGAFLPDARPDVEALNPLLPVAYRAGWGYLMLTNALPHLTKLTPEGGQGAFTLSAYALDVESHYTLLGHKTITLDNDDATVPFGAIDTPDQGETVATNISANFGWGMTQVGKCIDTTSTASYRVYIDGVVRPITPGVNWFPGLNRADIAAAFPGYCNSTNALAAYYIDADALGLANGIHTIGWDVIDNQGHVAGIGSRFFIIAR